MGVASTRLYASIITSGLLTQKQNLAVVRVFSYVMTNKHILCVLVASNMSLNDSLGCCRGDEQADKRQTKCVKVLQGNWKRKLIM